MDPTLLQILVGVLTNAFSSVVAKSWSTATGSDLESMVDAAAEEVATEIVGDPTLADSADVLVSPEATTLVRMLFVAQVNDLQDTTAELRSAFVDTYWRYVPKGDGNAPETLFNLLVAATESILVEAAQEGDAEAVEAMAAIRFRRLAEEIQGLRRSLEALQSAAEDEIHVFLDWEKEYRDQVLVRHGTITPPSFDAAERVPVDDIYVESRFSTTDDQDPARPSISPADLIRNLDRTVVLGDPGAGKSTFAMKLAYDLAKERMDLPGGPLTPLVVTLKDYGAEKINGRVSLVEWIESIANTDYATPAPEGAIPYLLAAGRVVVILDGLDELLDTSYRREITGDIEAFAARYVAAPILVTSRRIGYSQAPLDPRRFDIAYLCELDDDQVRQYVDMWFGLRSELTPGEQVEMARHFIRDSSGAASDLRSNALMLALLCNIYRGDGYIPRQRPQVYEKCAVMLFERWDRGRRIEVTLEFERHLRPAMQHLAFWIYSDRSLRGGVTEEDLIRSATEYLMGRRFDDEGDARQEARKFVEFCRGRAWVFTDTGTTADGENLYQFTHRTFLEFFAAEHLVRTHATPTVLGEVLRPRIWNGEWDVVAQLAFQLQDDNIDGAADELLVGLLAEHGGEEGLDASLGFAARSLGFLVPSRATCRAVASAVSRRAYDWLQELPEGRHDLFRGPIPDDHVGADTGPSASFKALVNLDRENFEPVAEAVVEEMLAVVEADPSIGSAEAALEIAPNADMATRSLLPRGNNALWLATQQAAFERMWPHLEPHLEKSDAITYDGVHFGLIDIEAAARARSVQSLFDSRDFVLYGAYIRSSLVEHALWGALGMQTRPDGSPLGDRDELEKLGGILAEAEPPWDTSGVGNRGLAGRFKHGALVPLEPELEGTSLFCAFALLATVSEHLESADELKIVLSSLRQSDGWPKMLAPWIARPYGGEPDGELPELSMNDRLRDLVAAWGSGQWTAIDDPGLDFGA